MKRWSYKDLTHITNFAVNSRDKLLLIKRTNNNRKLYTYRGQCDMLRKQKVVDRNGEDM